MANKNEVVIFRLTEPERELLQQKAAAANMSISKYVRNMALKGQVRDEKNLLSLVREINHIGNNINQATKIMNMYHNFDETDFTYIYKEFLKLKENVYKYIGTE